MFNCMSCKKTNLTTNQVKNYTSNPTGKGGFRENPQNRSNGRWKKEESISYNINKLMRLGRKEFATYIEKNPNLSIAEEIAWNRLYKARDLLAEAVFVTERTEGKPRQDVEFVGERDSINQRVPTEIEKKAARAYLEVLEKHTDY